MTTLPATPVAPNTLTLTPVFVMQPYALIPQFVPGPSAIPGARAGSGILTATAVPPTPLAGTPV